MKFRRRGITQKKAYKIQNKAKVWNEQQREYFSAPNDSRNSNDSHNNN